MTTKNWSRTAKLIEKWASNFRKLKMTTSWKKLSRKRSKHNNKKMIRIARWTNPLCRPNYPTSKLRNCLANTTATPKPSWLKKNYLRMILIWIKRKLSSHNLCSTILTKSKRKKKTSIWRTRAKQFQSEKSSGSRMEPVWKMRLVKLNRFRTCKNSRLD